MPPEAVGEVTLIRISDGECRLDHTYSRTQQLTGAPHPEAFKISMRRQSGCLRESARDVKGAARSERDRHRPEQG